MSTERDDEADEGLRRELARLPRELVPPQGLEARVVAALGERGLLAAARPRPNPWRLGGAVAACLALLIAGFWLGRQGASRGHRLATPSYLLMLRPGPDYNREGWSDARLTAETVQWAQSVLGLRRYVISNKLKMGGWVVTPSRVAGLPPVDSQDAPDGFFLIVASSDQEALDLARSCPFLRHGGRIDVRRINPN
jgi:hypothetical protein